MKNILAALAFIFVTTATAVAAQLPALGPDFPDQWEQVLDVQCTPKNPYYVLRVSAYQQDNGPHGHKGIILIEENGIRRVQKRASLSSEGIFRQLTEILMDDGHVAAFTDQEDMLEEGAAIEKVLGVTEEQFATCFKK